MHVQTGKFPLTSGVGPLSLYFSRAQLPPLTLSLECLGENKALVLLHETNTSCPAQVPIYLLPQDQYPCHILPSRWSSSPIHSGPGSSPPLIVTHSIFRDFFFFFFGCTGSSLLRGLSLVAVSRGYSSLRCAGCSLRCLLLLRSTGSRHAGFSSCGTQAQ